VYFLVVDMGDNASSVTPMHFANTPSKVGPQKPRQRYPAPIFVILVLSVIFTVVAYAFRYDATACDYFFEPTIKRSRHLILYS